VRNTISPHLVGVPTAPKGEMAPLWKPPSSLIAKKHTVTGQVKPIGQRGRPALLTGTIIHDASTLLLVLAGYSISRYKEPNKKSRLSKHCLTAQEIPAQKHAGMTKEMHAGLTEIFSRVLITFLTQTTKAVFKTALAINFNGKVE